MSVSERRVCVVTTTSELFIDKDSETVAQRELEELFPDRYGEDDANFQKYINSGATVTSPPCISPWHVPRGNRSNYGRGGSNRRGHCDRDSYRNYHRARDGTRSDGTRGDGYNDTRSMHSRYHPYSGR